MIVQKLICGVVGKAFLMPIETRRKKTEIKSPTRRYDITFISVQNSGTAEKL